MPENDFDLTSHLMRRAGFGAPVVEKDTLSSKSYEEIVEDLLHPERFDHPEEDALKRYNLDLVWYESPVTWSGYWLWRMINSQRPLEEKLALFWHQVFATGFYKHEHTPASVAQIELFRRVGMTDMRTILIELAKDPAMNYWLDNCENHADQPNENWGRELLELFSMGVGNYTEDDVKSAARAFTGWTFKQPIPLYPFGYYSSEFDYNEEDHDDSEKEFLGHTGRLNGEDIINIIVEEEATARFITRHLYSFFVSDEPPVSAWSVEEPQDPAAIEFLVKVFRDNKGQMTPVLRALFTSDFFKNARFQKVKSPAELVAGTIRLVGTYQFPDPKETITGLGTIVDAMGQGLMNPPTVEGWHTGHEWIDGGALNDRVNFAVGQFSDTTKPGIQEIITRIEGKLSPEGLVDRCLELVGPIEVEERTRSALVRHASKLGDIELDTDQVQQQENVDRIGKILQLIVASREYQFA